MAQVAEADEGTSVDGMKAACTMLAEPAGGRVATSTVALFVADADRLVVLLTAKSRQVFASSLAQVRERWIASLPLYHGSSSIMDPHHRALFEST
jgi:hypothetical protein